MEKRSSVLVMGWVKTNIRHLFNLLRIIYQEYPFTTIWYYVTKLFVWILAYPILAVVNKKSAKQICRSLDNRLSPYVVKLPLPYPLKGKVRVVEKESGYANLYCDDEYRKDLVKKGMIVVDIGAYIGLYTCLAAAIVGESGRVISFEPDPDNYEQLIENISINRLKNVDVFKCALSDISGQANLYQKHHGTVSSLIGKGVGIPVNVDRLDNILSGMNINKVDIIKIDVEGFEMPALKGAEKIIKNSEKIGLIVSSYHYPGEIKEVGSYLKDRGFVIDVNEEGILFASRNNSRG